MRTQVAIVGAGPAGTLLSLLLHRAGVESIVVERQTRQYVLGRVRAGILESGSVGILRQCGVGSNMDRLGVVHDGARVAWSGRSLFFDIASNTGRPFMAYGQSPLQRDLYDAVDEHGLTIVDGADEVMPHDVETTSPWLTYRLGGSEHRIDAEFVVGCDGYHGVCRSIIPPDAITTYTKEYPFGWLGILSETPPLPDLVYCNHPRGFALASQRNSMLSRYYVQCPLEDTIDDWPDERFWPELLARLPDELRARVVTGTTIEKSIAPVRSFVAEPLRHGNLFLAGDAAHIVPPTGAKGLNLAISDVHYLSRGLIDHFQHGDNTELDRYSEVALRRIWAAVRFSWWLTSLLHRFPDQSAMDQRLQEAELDHLSTSQHAMAALCEQYAGLPLEGRGDEVAPPGYDDIPGTFVFDGGRSRLGYQLNMCCMSLNDPANRDAFRADEAAYLANFALTDEQRKAVLQRQWLRMLELGGNIYYTFKLAACDGMSFQQLAALQTGVSEADYVEMMVGGGRTVEGNRSRSDPGWSATEGVRG